MNKKILLYISIVMIVLLLLLSIFILSRGYENYKAYTSYFTEAEKYNIEYDAKNYIVFKNEVTDLEQKITAAKEEEARLAAEQAQKEEEEARLAAEQQETTSTTKSANTDTCEPYYVDGTLLVNKNHCLPSSYAPGGLTPETSAAVNSMIYDASLEGISLKVVSGYRSYDTQVETFNYWVDTLGYEEAIQVSAEPGYSEHQTGLALDIGATNGVCELETCFEDTPEGQWVAQNAHKYGFIIRYPNGQESITGYTYEPWHLRYVGVDMATEIYNSKVTLEEYLGVY